jgi:hypothetical protein
MEMNQKYPSIENEALSAFAISAAAFCDLIESRARRPRESFLA